MTTWMLVIWLHVAPPGKPILLAPEAFGTEAACQAKGESEIARLGEKHIWFCIGIKEPAMGRKDA